MADSPEYVALILAAGLSSRMGRDKASLPWLEERTLLEWTVENLVSSGWRPTVVFGPHNHQNRISRIPGICSVLNPDPSRGKTSSIATGAAALPPGARSILLASVDQPRPPALYRLLREAAKEDRIVLPGDAQHRDHPIVLGAAFRKNLLALEEQTHGLRGLLDAQQDKVVRVPCPPEWLRWDCNDPAAYEAALAWFRAL